MMMGVARANSNLCYAGVMVTMWEALLFLAGHSIQDFMGTHKEDPTEFIMEMFDAKNEQEDIMALFETMLANLPDKGKFTKTREETTITCPCGKNTT